MAEILPVDSADWLTRLQGDNARWLDNAPAILDPLRVGKYFASVSRSEATGWLVVAEVPVDEALAELYRQLAWLGGVLVLAVAVMAIAHFAYGVPINDEAGEPLPHRDLIIIFSIAPILTAIVFATGVWMLAHPKKEAEN